MDPSSPSQILSVPTMTLPESRNPLGGTTRVFMGTLVTLTPEMSSVVCRLALCLCVATSSLPHGLPGTAPTRICVSDLQLRVLNTTLLARAFLAGCVLCADQGKSHLFSSTSVVSWPQRELLMGDPKPGFCSQNSASRKT